MTFECPVCGTTISQEAKSCPKCGQPEPYKNKTEIIAKKNPLLTMILLPIVHLLQNLYNGVFNSPINLKYILRMLAILFVFVILIATCSPTK
jgi:uncharacterized membrane protein YvbJ